MNFQSSYFKDSYRAEIDHLDSRRKLIREIMDFQIRKEKEVVAKTHDHLEEKLELVNLHLM